MTELDMISAVIDRINWSGLMHFVVIVGIVLIAFQIRLARQLEDYVHCDHGPAGHLRSVSLGLMMLALIWGELYGIERGWTPWPPMVAFVLTLDLNIVSRIIIMYQDMREHRRRKERLVMQR